MNVSHVGLKKMHIRPDAGARIDVILKDGAVLQGCYATLVTMQDKQGIIIYHRKKSIDETKAKGWRLNHETQKQ